MSSKSALRAHLDAEDRKTLAHPPRRYCASHPYIVRRLILKDLATTSGFSPACTLRTARIRIASSVA